MAVAAVFALVGLLLPGDGRAQDGAALAATQELFTARDVTVDVTADNALKARDQALLEAQAKGLAQVLRDLTPPGEQGRVPQVSAQDAQNYVLSLQVKDEKRSSVRYIATLDILYNPNAVRALLRQSGISFTETARTPVLVLPLWQSAADAPPTLWEDPNPWREAWQRRPSGGLVPATTPLGDLGDLQAISADEAAARQAGAVRRILQRYEMTEGVIAHAIRSGESRLQIELTRLRLAGEPTQASLSVDRQPGEDEAAFLTRATNEVANRLRDEWRAATVAASASEAPSQVTVLVPTGSLDTWLTVRERLSQVPIVRGVDIQALSRERAQILLGYVGSQDQLALTLAQYGLDLSDLGGGLWQIELRRGAGGAPAPQAPAGAGGGLGQPQPLAQPGMMPQGQAPGAAPGQPQPPLQPQQPRPAGQGQVIVPPAVAQ
ncbi:DUF2066 domain-containing protein [Caenispirillum bisanense]|uniref:DUF2066 domain-containing protein n=1 Tax=Caenispirillum bisanense TaxID=414052 RepID=UPI0031DF7560